MVSCRRQGIDGATPVQGGQGRGWRASAALLTALALAACAHDPLDTPVNWWHGLVGGTIAANRPPPPGADLPYPHLGTIPKKPEVPSASFRDTVQTRLTDQRDDTERLAARTPIGFVSQTVPPPPKPLAAPPADTANASLPGAEASPPKAAHASAPAQTADHSSGLGLAAGTPVTLAGAPLGSADLPPIPDVPPSPPTFEGVPAQPAPTPPPPLPTHVALKLAGSTVLFAPGDATLDHSQTETLKDIAGRRGHGQIEIEGHGETQADSPTAQATALALGLKRAQAVATGLAALHVPQDKMLLSATAFGRDASLRLIP
jgi:outer membrane protein OmpA-like peptidoglycan-associated protein